MPLSATTLAAATTRVGVIPPTTAVGREYTPCENILCRYLYDGDLVFVIMKGIYGFKIPKGFWRSLPEISLLLSSFVNPNHLKT